ncbi:hypothetical protein EJB05_13637, partial [Eragrostis curvula]
MEKINANNGQNYIRFILMDEEGSKMEAMAFGKACFTTNQGISEGEVYNFTSVGFGSTHDVYLYKLFYIRREYYVNITTETEIKIPETKISIPLLPRTFMEFKMVPFCPHRTYTDVIGVIVYISDITGEDNSRLQRSKYVAIMDSRGNMITVHVRGTKFFQNNDGWREQEKVFQTMAAVHVKVNKKKAILATTPYSEIIFSPKRAEAKELEGFQNHLLRDRQRAQRFARKCMLRLRVKKK